jgi:rubrerythrin
MKKYWKCKVCADIHYGNGGPEVCPTCKAKNAYAEIEKDEAKEAMGI